MLGRLARWLRLFGQDALYFRQAPDSLLLRVCLEDPGRRLLTRDTLLLRRRPVLHGEIPALRISSDRLEEQLRQVAEWSGFTPRFPRCPVDNAELLAVPKAEVDGRVPPYVFASQEQFHQCPSCRRLYWRATHWKRIATLRVRVFGTEFD
ncbi:MAG: hypothetical protein C4521_05815 [Actinobacteria bacterium]|nr:MAG: hypothetical protein C4521_05815 [Actinomycetota bacterium]